MGSIIKTASTIGHPKYNIMIIMANINPFLNVKMFPKPEHE